ncbi:PAS domain S-box protein [Aquabacterium sp.]|uniref:PAS domain-containing sensor histidine kinase n=1 Tax=Aquabacterium sp. TaxID=1872578 RepID=UPI0035AE5B95
MVNESGEKQEVPRVLMRLMTALEKWTGGVRTSHAVGAILLIGSVLTMLIVMVVWQSEYQRNRREFEAIAGQAEALIHERIDSRAWMLSESARMIESERMSGADIGCRSRGEWAFVPVPDKLHEENWRDCLSPVSADVNHVMRVLQAISPDDRVHLSPQLSAAVGQPRWVLVQRVAQLGWVTNELSEHTLLPGVDEHGGWKLTLRLSREQPGGSEWLGDQGLAVVRSLAVADSTLMLQIRGERRGGGWSDLLSRYAGVWIAGICGMFFTLGVLHAYLMLISTRMRARDMAREMGSALQRTQSRSQAVMDTAADAIIMVDQTGAIRWCNRATTSIFGRSPEELDGLAANSIIPSLPADESGLAGWFEQFGFSNRVMSHDTMGRRAEGTEFPITVSASKAELEGELIQTFIVRDTTDAKWAEQELLLRDRALASSADGVIITSMTLPNQPVIYANKAFEHITGYDAYEILGMNCKILQGSDTDQPGVHAMREAIRDGKSCQVVLRNYRKDGTMFWNELAISPVQSPDGVVTHYVGVQSDITERMAAEQVLHVRTERLNAVFDLSPDGFVVLDKRGEICIVNPAFEGMTGLYAADLVGQSMAAFEEHLMARCQSRELVGDGEDACEYNPEGGGAAASAGAVSRRELLHLHTPCNRTLMRRVRHGGADREVVMYFRDITQELEVDRMKSEFLSMAAHELRTPMASIFGFTELLIKRQFDDTRRLDMLQTIHRQASILINLINELLDLARIEARRGKDFKRKVQRLQPIVEATIAGLLIHNDSRKVGHALPELPIWVDVDTEKLSLAITNVLSNAYKYSPKGGDINLDLVWRDGLSGRECGVQVTDHGLGMTSEQCTKVFERFFRADTSGNIPGTGLGMTIVKEIIELHGGRVEVVSAFGVGTTVTLWLPVADESLVTSGEPEMMA